MSEKSRRQKTDYAKSTKVEKLNAVRYSQPMDVRERRKREAKYEITQLIEACGISRAERLLDVHRTTIHRWLAGTIQPPVTVLYTLRADVYGQLPNMTNKDWEGWRFGNDGMLYSPDGRGFHAGHLLSHQYLHHLISAQRQEITSLREKIANLERNLDLMHTAANDRRA